MVQNADNWRRKAESLSHAVDKLYDTINSQTELLRIRNAQLEQAQKAIDQTRETLRHTIADNAVTMANLNARVSALMAKLKELGFADFDNLGN